MRRTLLTILAPVGVVGALLLVEACLGVAGLNSNLTYGSPDGSANGSDDGSPAGGACPGTTPTQLFTTNEAFASQVTLVLNASYVYLNIIYGTDGTNTTAGVLGCPKAGCVNGPETVGLTTNNAIGSDTSVIYGGTAASSSHVYYTLSPDGENGGGKEGLITETDLNGGGSTAFVTGLAQPDYMAASQSDVFFVNDPDGFGDAGASESIWQVYSCPLSGCTQPTLVMNGEATAAYSIAVDTSNVYVLDVGFQGGYGRIFSCPLGQQCPDALSPLVSTLSTSVQLYMNANSSNGGYLADTFAGDGTYLYWTNGVDGSIERILVAGGPGGDVQTIAMNLSTPSSLALDATYVYWVDFTGQIQRTVKDGSGSVQTILCGLSFPSALAVDTQNVYIAVVDPSGMQPTEVVTIPVPP